MELLITALSSTLIMILVGWANEKNYFDKPELTFADEGDFVRVRGNSYARFYKTTGKLVKKTDIVKIQKAGCLSLFYKSQSVIDITVHPKSKVEVFNRAKELFCNAESVDIE